MMAARLEGLVGWEGRSSYTDGFKTPLSQLNFPSSLEPQASSRGEGVAPS
jgi:hypothetical protein